MSIRLSLTAAFSVLAFSLASAPITASAQVHIISKLGGKCLDAENGQTADGTRLIGYPCSPSSSNQKFTFETDGTVRLERKCVDASGGLGADGNQIILWSCNGGANQKWELTSANQLPGINGKCIDLKGGSGWWNLPGNNQPAVLWSCHGGDNQAWFRGYEMSPTRLSGYVRISPGQQQTVTPIAGLIGSSSANVIAAGGANVIGNSVGNAVGGGTGRSVLQVDGSGDTQASLPAPPSGASPAGGQPYVYRLHPTRCMAVDGGSYQEDTRLILWQCDGTPSQQFLLEPDGYLVAFGGLPDSQGKKMCVDSYPEGKVAKIWPYRPLTGLNDSQRWTRAPLYTFRAGNGGCLVPEMPSDGATLLTASCYWSLPTLG